MLKCCLFKFSMSFFLLVVSSHFWLTRFSSISHIFSLWLKVKYFYFASTASPVLPYSACLHGWKGYIKLSLEILQVCRDITIRRKLAKGTFTSTKNQYRMWNCLWLGFVLQMSCRHLCWHITLHIHENKMFSCHLDYHGKTF